MVNKQSTEWKRGLAGNRTAIEPLARLAVDAIRFLSVDAVQKANSGHPGLPMGAAPMAFVLWQHFLRHNPANPGWFDRDRFVLSAGHGSMLLYSLLHLTGYALPLDQLQRFRQWDSITPGHPERGLTPGVEVTTGPLGQGFANGVGLAIAEAHLAARYNRPGFPLVDHFTYGLVSDGDLMEGVAAEAASLAGVLQLSKLIYFFDDNRITLAGSTDLVVREDVRERFHAIGWHTQVVEDGNDLDAIDAALRAARNEQLRPSLIQVRTHLGYGAPNKQDTFDAHGSPLGAEEVLAAKQHLGWPLGPDFHVPPDVLAYLRRAQTRGSQAEAEWNRMFQSYRVAFPELGQELEQRMRGELPMDWDADLPVFPPDAKGMATRVASGKVMQAIAGRVPSLFGGSADLDPSTHTQLRHAGDFQGPREKPADVQGAAGGDWSYRGRNLHFGVREHAMAAVANGLAAHGGMLPYTGTFLTFSDYMRPAIRLGALSGLGVVHVFTHDSVGLGEDGPTHQPVEHLASLRAIPNLVVIRPGDANETTEAWRVAVARRDCPVALVLSRQELPILDRGERGDQPGRLAPAAGLARGAYVLLDPPGGSAQAVLIASGSEVSLIVAAEALLREQNVAVRLVSMPSWELFEAESVAYRESVLPSSLPLRLAVEAGVRQGWERYVGCHGDVLSIDRFGASAPGPVVLREYGYTAEEVCRRVLDLLRTRSAGSDVPTR